MNRLFAVLLLCFAISGCDKQDFFEFDLRVIDNNGDPVSEAEVVALLQPAGVQGSNQPFESIGTYSSDASGRINLQVDKQTVYSYRFIIAKEGFYDDTISVNPDDVPFTEPYVGDLQIDGRSWIDIHIVNEMNSIAVFFTVEADAPECDDCCDGNLDFRTGFGVDEHFVCSMYSDQLYQLTGSFTDSINGINPFEHDLNSVQGDTLHFLLSY